MTAPITSAEPVYELTFVFPSNPEWIRLPLKLGGEKRDILEVLEDEPCICTIGHTCRHYSLGDMLYVAECPYCGWLWYIRMNG